MAASENHSQKATHAHILLAGFVVSFIYGLCHKLWLRDANDLLVKLQYYLHQLGIFLMSLGLFLLYGGFAKLESVDPILAISSIGVLGGMILMLLLFVGTTNHT